MRLPQHGVRVARTVNNGITGNINTDTPAAGEITVLDSLHVDCQDGSTGPYLSGKIVGVTSGSTYAFYKIARAAGIGASIDVPNIDVRSVDPANNHLGVAEALQIQIDTGGAAGVPFAIHATYHFERFQQL